MQEERDQLAARLDWIQEHPDLYAAERLQHIDAALARVPQRKPSRGNTSMHDHLTALRAAYATTPHPNPRTQSDLDALAARIAALDEEV